MISQATSDIIKETYILFLFGSSVKDISAILSIYDYSYNYEFYAESLDEIELEIAAKMFIRKYQILDKEMDPVMYSIYIMALVDKNLHVLQHLGDVSFKALYKVKLDSLWADNELLIKFYKKYSPFSSDQKINRIKFSYKKSS